MIGEASKAVQKAVREAEDDVRRRRRYRSLMNRCDELLDALERWNLAEVKGINSILMVMLQTFQRDVGTDHRIDYSSVQAALDSLLEVQGEIMSWNLNLVFVDPSEAVP